MLALATALLLSHATAAAPLRLAPELQLRLGSGAVTNVSPLATPTTVPPQATPVSIFSGTTVGTGFLGVVLGDAAAFGLTLALFGGASAHPGSIAWVVTLVLFDTLIAPLGAVLGSALGVPRPTSYKFLAYLASLGTQALAAALLGVLWDASEVAAMVVAGLVHFVGMPMTSAKLIRAPPPQQAWPFTTGPGGRAAPGGPWLIDVRF